MYIVAFFSYDVVHPVTLNSNNGTCVLHLVANVKVKHGSSRKKYGCTSKVSLMRVMHYPKSRIKFTKMQIFWGTTTFSVKDKTSSNQSNFLLPEMIIAVRSVVIRALSQLHVILSSDCIFKKVHNNERSLYYCNKYFNC